MGFDVTIIGSGATMPTLKRGVSAQALDFEQSIALIDCGEGTQHRLKPNGIRMGRVDTIFISHLHGDHCFGLAGLIFTMNLLARKKKLTVFSPPGLKYMFEVQQKVTRSFLSFPVEFIELKHTGCEQIFNSKLYEVDAFPLRHRIPTYGFIFREQKKPRQLRRDFVESYHPSFAEMKAIKAGADYVHPEEGIFPNRAITKLQVAPKSYAYCSDTAYAPQIVPFLKGVDLLYHEATFSEAEAELAVKRSHSTAKQAASIAQQSEVKRLIMGHISARFTDSYFVLEREARVLFEHSKVVNDGDKYHVG